MTDGTGSPRVPEQVERVAEWRAMLERQYGIVSWAQLVEFRITRSATRAQVRAGRWQRAGQRVYATFTGALPREARLTAGLLYAGPSALLSNRTAGEQWRMYPAAASGPVHVTVPYGSSAISQPGLVVVHRSRAIEHIRVAAAFPVTSRADTVIDLAAAQPLPQQAARTLTELVTAGGASALEVRRRLVERPPRRYRDALADALRLIEDGVQSVLEELYAVDVERAHALPSARRQVPVVVDGRTLLEDAVYDHVGVPLTVRLDGRSHLTPFVAHRDRRRDNTAEIAGRSRLVFGWTEVSSDPCAVAAEVSSVLSRHGWRGHLQVCLRCSRS